MRDFTINLIDSEDFVEVWVMIDGVTVYNNQHWYEEETVTLSLIALEGEHMVEVYQDRMPHSQEVIVF